MAETMIIKGEVMGTRYENNQFSIRNFRASKNIKAPDGSEIRSFALKGNFIPAALMVTVEGSFESKPFVASSGYKSWTFNVTDCSELKENTREGIVRYLNSLKGVGKTVAERIFEAFGTDTFSILDDDIERLKEIKGVGKNNFKTISRDYLSRGVAKELYAYLYRFGVSGKNADKIFAKWKVDALETCRKQPYGLYLDGYIGFRAAELIGESEHIDRLDENRIKAAIAYSVQNNELKGNVYMEWKELYLSTLKILGVQSETKETKRKIVDIIRDITKNKLGGRVSIRTRIEDSAPIFYRTNTLMAEEGTARELARLLSNDSKNKKDYSKDIQEAEKNLGLLLSPEQEEAVQSALNHSVSIVTGGPGTGKTSFQKVLFDVFRKNFKGQEIVLAAPTGRAARRMTEASGLDASTLHSLLKLGVSDSDSDIIDLKGSKTPEKVHAGLLVVDEVSMMDTFLSYSLFQAIEDGTKVVLVGDIHQLPSVGCGAVLKTLIESGKVPTVYFTEVFRQAGTSSIAINASRINAGNHLMEKDEACVFIEAKTPEEILEKVKELYEKSVEEFGIDEVSVLTPYRKSTITGVNKLNPELREVINKGQSSRVGGKNLFLHDKVMYTKNEGALTNGDLGYIRKIEKVDSEYEVTVAFEGNRTVILAGDDLENLVPAYAFTIHKSQGSEFKCCIIIIDKQHLSLLKRNLVYTALTRAKTKCYFVGDVSGEDNLFDKSIDVEDAFKRKTELAGLIQKIC